MGQLFDAVLQEITDNKDNYKYAVKFLNIQLCKGYKREDRIGIGDLYPMTYMDKGCYIYLTHAVSKSSPTGRSLNKYFNKAVMYVESEDGNEAMNMNLELMGLLRAVKRRLYENSRGTK